MGYNCNLLCIIAPDSDRALLCLRRRPPYQGKYNFVGGKIEPGEDGLTAAYRELFEETGISREDVGLIHLMNLEYPLEGGRLEVWAGRLKHPVAVHGDENDLVWFPLTENFFDPARFAGVGNVGHILEYARFLPEVIVPEEDVGDPPHQSDFV